MKGKIYKITNSINDKVYIGKTYSTIEKRMLEHIQDSTKEKNKTRPLYRAFNKYGYENFFIEEIGVFDEGELENKEIEFIAKYNSYSNGYNATLGGDGKRYFECSDEEVINFYLSNGYVNQTSEHFNCCVDTIRAILRNNNIDIAKHVNINTGFEPKKIKMIYNETESEFDDITTAAKWIFENNLSTSSDVQVIRRGISRVVNGTRKSYLNRKWERI